MLATVVAAVAAIAAPSDTLAAKGCPKFRATVVSGDVTDFNSQAPEGAPLAGKTLKYPGHFFRADSDVTFRIYGNRAKVTAGSMFKFSCYAASASSPQWPSVMLLNGSVTVDSAARKPLGVLTNEGLFDSRSKKMRYRVTRETTKSELDMDDYIAWFANYSSQPKGTTDVKSLSGGKIVGVTPYVGPRKGSCRYCKSATLSSAPGEPAAKYELG